MAETKTKPTTTSVESFLDQATDERTRNDCYIIISLMEKITGEKAKMWGSAIIGFGQYHYKYDSGREGDMCLVGFSPRKGKLALYVSAGAPFQAELLQQLGKHTTGKGCLYIKKIDDINIDILEKMIKNSAERIKQQYPD